MKKTLKCEIAPLALIIFLTSASTMFSRTTKAEEPSTTIFTDPLGVQAT